MDRTIHVSEVADLFELAQIFADATGGLIAIEDGRSRMLAYSAHGDDAADSVRRLSVLGREGPAGYLRWLQRDGVLNRLRNTVDLVEISADPEWRTRRRLAIGIREPEQTGGSGRAMLGTIWLQESDQPLHPDSGEMLRGAAAIAATTIWRARNVPSADALLLERLFGAHDGVLDIPTTAARFGLPGNGRGAVIGFSSQSPGGNDHEAKRRLMAALSLHAKAFRPDCVTTVIDGRPYVLFGDHQSTDRVASWTRQTIASLTAQPGPPLRAAISAPVAGLADVARARTEVDRVLNRTEHQPGADPVTTLEQSRTAVLLGELLTLIAEHPHLRDPRLDTLLAYDTDHAAELHPSLEAYLHHHGDVRRAAAQLQIHPNTLRYRVRRASQITGITLDSAPDRLLLEIQLAAHRQANDHRAQDDMLRRPCSTSHPNPPLSPNSPATSGRHGGTGRRELGQ